MKSRSLPSRPSSASRTEPPTRARREPGLLEAAGEVVGDGGDPQQFTHRAALHLAQGTGVVFVGVRHNRKGYVARPAAVASIDVHRLRAAPSPTALIRAHTGQSGPRPILWSGPRHFPSARIVTMRGRTFRRPLTTTRDGRARGRGGRLPGDESLTCPPVAAAHRRAARRGAPAGRSVPGPAAASASAAPTLPGRAPRVEHGRGLPGLAQPRARPTDGDTVTVSGTVTNKGKQTVTDAHVGLRVAPRCTADSAIDDAAKRSGYRPVRRRRRRSAASTRRSSPSWPPVSASPSPSRCPVEGAGPRPRTGSTSWASRCRAGPGRAVRPGARHRADVPALAARRRRARKTRLTYLWPLISTAHLTAETGSGRAADARLPRTTTSPRRSRRAAACSRWSRSARTWPSPG